VADIGVSRARERAPSKANLPGKSLSLPAQVDQVGFTTLHLPLLVFKVFRGVWVPLPAHLGYSANQLSLPPGGGGEKNNSLEVSLDEMIVVVLFEDPRSRVAEDAISLLVRECT
jgi:hypothetical protein